MKIKQKTDYTKLPNPSDLAQTEKMGSCVCGVDQSQGEELKVQEKVGWHHL